MVGWFDVAQSRCDRSNALRAEVDDLVCLHQQDLVVQEMAKRRNPN